MQTLNSIVRQYFRRVLVGTLSVIPVAAAPTATNSSAPVPALPEIHDRAHMFAVGEIGDSPESFDWYTLRRVRLERGVIFAGKPPAAGFNMHGYITFFDGRFWAMWSCGNGFEDVSGQYVRYATSGNGLEWSPSKILIPADPAGEMRYFARGLWVRDGELLALAARDDAWSVVDGKRVKGKLFGPRLKLIAHRWNPASSTWSYKGVVVDNTINNFPPKQTPSGEWMMSRRDHNQTLFVAIGGVAGFDQWRMYPVPEAEDGPRHLDEPHWWTLPNGTLAAHFRATSESFRLHGTFRHYRAFSHDGGRTWTRPIRTNFPDAKAKFNCLRVSTGKYAFVSNPRGGVDPRIPLTLSTSTDGLVFTDMRILLDEPTEARYPNRTKHAGYQYPQLVEANGFLFVVVSKNQEDIEVLKIPLQEI